ncbi:hypothetical protein QKU48_gp0714 [Fadolivirus algeromassiliense]|jgi:hypothetical protein|uniref:Sphingomyelin synthase-like domain-containing protein n=1 Tax=Fadolivirus FV1/VV64 TaxID=3070911 RepID=A0A7D3V5Q8_9VIRU|nr:hypothetical protein QKU48_gp0714 [Fadolivirus algeromassiliense]QKF94172.1 hypothetical protein Fadolivirus_1_714 [Fadolivirus FV1/VV64]
MQSKLRNLLLFLFLHIFWNATQTFLENDLHNNTVIIDRLHSSNIVINIQNYLINNKQIMDMCFIITTLLIDLHVFYFVYDFFANNNIKPMYLLVGGILLRQLCQYINRLPSPENVIWYDPGFPTFVMNYNVANDFFFSGHTLSSLIFGIELLSSKYSIVKIYAVVYMVFEITFVIVTHAHYFMDIYGATATYFMLCYFYDKFQ